MESPASSATTLSNAIHVNHFDSLCLTSSTEEFTKLATTLAPGGVLNLKELTTLKPQSYVEIPLRTTQELVSELNLAGFVDLEIYEAKKVEMADLERIIEYVWSTRNIQDQTRRQELIQALNGQLNVIELRAKKPTYEVGATFALPFATKASKGDNSTVNKKAIWTLTGDDEELENEDELLDDDDLIKPDKSTLVRPDCETSGKRKACKNCSCGLSEELEKEKLATQQTQQIKSSCGNCYLGDAFRCSTCPYLGMPSFAPVKNKMKMTTRWAKSSIVKQKPNVDIVSKTNGKAKFTPRVIPRNSKVSRIRLHSPTKHVDRRTTNSDQVEICQPKGSKLKTAIYSREQEYNTSNNDNEPCLNLHDNDLNHKEIMVTLAESLKKRENQIAKSMDQRFELSRITVTNALGCYIEEEDNITTKVASEYKHRMDEYAEEKRNCLRKLRLGFEKYQLIISDLLEALDKNHSQSMRARRDFEKDIAHIRRLKLSFLNPNY
ncbi:anamorsin [Gigaspora margarita]|uniref:Anamorsin n=1 Tax=Gigaspora margarita TaxID=4874 RepID=A0A8H4A3G0_GIGMA|nr:anamorsin [Gigaspora margarita]